jgi:hypothetical protein
VIDKAEVILPSLGDNATQNLDTEYECCGFLEKNQFVVIQK